MICKTMERVWESRNSYCGLETNYSARIGLYSFVKLGKKGSSEVIWTSVYVHRFKDLW